MKLRLLAITTFCILLGSLANIALAAACALYSPVRSHTWTSTTTPPREEWAEFGTPIKYTTTQIISCIGYQYTRKDVQSQISGGCEIMVHDPVHSARAGWPLHAFRGTRDPNRQLIQPTLWKPPAAIPPAPSRTVAMLREFPITPIWRGIAVNSSLFTAAFLILSVILHQLRNRLRIRAGLCPACRYPSGASPVCTECGSSLPERSLPA